MEETNNESNCEYCSEAIIGKPEKCTACGFPLSGSPEEKTTFKNLQKTLSIDAHLAPKRIKQATDTLYIVAVIQILFTLFFYFRDDSLIDLVAGSVLFLIYLILGFWSQTKPYPALILALIVYLFPVLISTLLDPSTIFSRIIFKIVIFIFLARGINSARALKKMQQ